MNHHYDIPCYPPWVKMPSVFGPQSWWDDMGWPEGSRWSRTCSTCSSVWGGRTRPDVEAPSDGGFTSRANRVSGARPGLTKVIYMSVGCFGWLKFHHFLSLGCQKCCTFQQNWATARSKKNLTEKCRARLTLRVLRLVSDEIFRPLSWFELSGSLQEAARQLGDLQASQQQQEAGSMEPWLRGKMGKLEERSNQGMMICRLSGEWCIFEIYR